jgi:hypothetical protein
MSDSLLTLTRYAKRDCSPLIADYTLSEIVKRRDNTGVFYEIPDHIYDDCPDLDRDKVYRNFASIVRMRIAACTECCFNDSELPFVPFISFLATDDKKELLAMLSDHIAEYPFVKLCSMSPKDVSPTCVFDSAEDALNALTTSSRTRDWAHSHIIMKRRREFDAEFRCFIYKDILRLIVVSEWDCVQLPDTAKVADFISRWRHCLPHCVCVEVGQSSEYGLEIIELNAFGPDLICDQTPFRWDENLMDFYGETTEPAVAFSASSSLTRLNTSSERI